MGRGSSGNGSGTNPYNSNQKGKSIAVNGNGRRVSAKRMKIIIDSSTSIKDMENRDMQKELQQAISRFAAAFGLPERNIRLANLDGSYGVTYFDENGPKAVYLKKSAFDRPKKEVVEAYTKSNYARRGGYKNVTRNPAQHTITHELTHALWTSYYTGSKQQAAGNEIKALYREFMNDKSSSRKKNYGSYGTSSVDEFWAEAITKGLHGDNDRYTRRAMKIAKRYLAK